MFASGQGLENDPDASLGASKAQKRLAAMYGQSVAFRRSYAKAKAQTATVCNAQSGSLCANSNAEQKATLLMATSPQVFDARSAQQMGGFTAVGAPKSQGDCNTCVAFALLGAAQSAMASVLKKDCTSAVSEQDFYFCKSVSGGPEERTCSSSWAFKPALDSFISLINAKNYPVTEQCMQYDPNNVGCSYDCREILPDLKLGTFTYVKLENPWDMQEHIRNYGSILSGLDLYDDFLPFFESTPMGVYPGHGSKAKLVTRHAIQIVGYDNVQQFWLCKNSYGPGWGSEGFFRVAVGVDGIAAPGSTYGMKFKPFNTPARPMNRLTEVPGKPQCYYYKAKQSDYVSRVAFEWGIPVQQLLMDNLNVILGEPDELLGGKTLSLCNIDSAKPASSPSVTEDDGPGAPMTGTAAVPTITLMSGQVISLPDLFKALNNSCCAPRAVLGDFTPIVRMDNSVGQYYVTADPDCKTAAIESVAYPAMFEAINLCGKCAGGKCPIVDGGLNLVLPQDWCVDNNNTADPSVVCSTQASVCDAGYSGKCIPLPEDAKQPVPASDGPSMTLQSGMVVSFNAVAQLYPGQCCLPRSILNEYTPILRLDNSDGKVFVSNDPACSTPITSNYYPAMFEYMYVCTESCPPGGCLKDRQQAAPEGSSSPTSSGGNGGGSGDGGGGGGGGGAVAVAISITIVVDGGVTLVRPGSSCDPYDYVDSACWGVAPYCSYAGVCIGIPHYNDAFSSNSWGPDWDYYCPVWWRPLPPVYKPIWWKHKPQVSGPAG
eukprot:gene12121-12260_t